MTPTTPQQKDNGADPINDALLMIGKAAIDLRNNCKNDDFLVRRVTAWLDGSMKVLKNFAAAPVGTNVAAEFKKWFISAAYEQGESNAFAAGFRLAAGAPAETPKHDICAEMRALCTYCGGTGDVHSIDGEWRGRCTCPAGAAQPAGATDAKDAARLDFLGSRHVVSLHQYEPHEGAPFIEIEMDGPGRIRAATVREAIDAAMLAPANSEKPL